MKLENQVTSLELSKKLKSLNFEQESLFYWITDSHPYGSTFVEDIGTASLSQSKEGDNYYSAYTVAELGEFLKKVNFEKSKIKTLPEEFCPRTEDESLKVTFDQNFWAKMLIYLKEQELI